MHTGVVSPGLDRLMEAVVVDPREVGLLLQALRQWTDSDAPIVVEGLLEDRARRLKARETAGKDIDETIALAAAALPAVLFVGSASGSLRAPSPGGPDR